jgi:hypothetical protein
MFKKSESFLRTLGIYRYEEMACLYLNKPVLN